jgi:nucleotide-binding universal stress UspA family protein
MLPIRRILIPIDWSESSNQALQLAASLARQYHADLDILFVVPLATVMYGPPPESYLEHLRDELCRMTPAGFKTGIHHLLAEGDPARTIIRVARENRCDLIVMGTHGRTGVKRVLFGSVAEEVLRKAPCPVMTVKAEPDVCRPE